QPDLSLGEVQTCLDLPYHLSYPHVFEHVGEVFMIPESGANRTCELWRATSFPAKWTLEKVLFPAALLDTTPLLHHGRCHFFTTFDESGHALGALFSADHLTAEWVHHPQSPISTDVRTARCAGAIFRSGQRLLRPVQDCAERYGRRIHLLEILELSPDCY